VQLCRDSNVAFVWGPPGTGKTRTISHIVIELLAQGHRVLLTSTTNAAIDQALAILATHPAAEEYMRDGRIVRVGQTDAATYGASLGEVIKRQNATLRQQLDKLRKRNRVVSDQLHACEKVLRTLKGASGGRQLDMFVQVPDDALHSADLSGIFTYRRANRILTLMSAHKQAIIDRRRRRLERANALYNARIRASLDKLSGAEQTVMANARVVLATMTNMYISRLLMAEAFDAVIVEEAGMAVLPILFYCAGLAARKVIAVGDPRQLPPIVLSRDPYVQRAMGRDIFDVTVPDPERSEVVVMLDTQYRMHPSIGALVSGLFYGGKLTSDRSTVGRDAIASRHPYPGQPLVVVDTEGATRCARSEGSFSRFNQETAEVCVRLAEEAVADGIASVAIITPYAQQSRLISGLLAASAIPEGVVECRTVHRFQGNERDLVILDTVDTLPERPGVLLAGRRGASSAPHLLNVSLSRAKGKLVIVSDVGYFRSQAAGSAIDQVLTAALEVGVRAGMPAVP
jgi:superfamily I DNA and/or RNA helicase